VFPWVPPPAKLPPQKGDILYHLTKRYWPQDLKRSVGSDLSCDKVWQNSAAFAAAAASTVRYGNAMGMVLKLLKKTGEIKLRFRQEDVTSGVRVSDDGAWLEFFR
jgi:hypothetical protein